MERTRALIIAGAITCVIAAAGAASAASIGGSHPVGPKRPTPVVVKVVHSSGVTEPPTTLAPT